MMKQWLGQQTRAAGQSLVAAAPLAVTSEQVAGVDGRRLLPGPLDRGPLESLTLAAELTEQQVAEEQRQLREAAEEKAGADLALLEELLEDEPADAGQVRAALEQMGENATDDYYSEALVGALGPEGMPDLYDRLGRQMPTYYEVEEIWPDR